MKTPQLLLFLLASATLFAASNLNAATTDPVGYITSELTAGADNFVTVPLKSAPDFTGSVSTATAQGVDMYVITLAGAVNFSDDVFNDTHYLRFLDNAGEGKHFAILDTLSNSLIIDSLGDDLSAVMLNDRVEVVRYWTLAQLFDPATQESLVVSTGNLPFQRGSQVLLPDLQGVGRNKAPKNAFFITDTEWRRASDFSNADDVVLLPESYIIVRQDSAAGVRKLIVSGTVPTEKLTAYIYQETVDNDTLLTHGRPNAMRLDQLGFGTEFSDSSGNLPFQRSDQLLVWFNPQGRNPAPDTTFFRVGGEWRRASDFSNADDFLLESNTAFIVRKKGQGTAVTKTWKNSPTY